MKLILASDLSFLLKYGYDLTGIPKNQMKIGYVTTASKGARTFGQRVQEIIMPTIRENGYNIEEIDIKDKSKEELLTFFKNKNVIHIEGGNAFYLLKVIRETGFADILKELLNEGRVYIGTSAGSYIMCPTIEVSDWNQDGRDRFGLTDFTALNYIPFVLKVHYEDEMNELVKEKSKTLKYPLHILRDGQGMFCDNGTCRFVGGEDEVRFN